MRLTIGSINNVLEEIQFYEQIGYHKTADKLTQILKKVAWNFNVDEMNYPYIKNVTKVAEISRLMDILNKTPSCASLLADFHNKQPMMYQDPRDCREQKTRQWQQNNPGQQISPQMIQQITEECTESIVNMMNSPYLSNDPNFMKCMEALGDMGYSGDFSQAFPQQAQAVQQAKQTQQTQTQQQNVPPVV